MLRQVYPYRLAYQPDQQLICVQGDPRILQSLVHFQGTTVVGDIYRDGYVSVPLSRAAVMAVEAISTVTSASRAYREMRPSVMQYDLSLLHAMWPHLNLEVGRPYKLHQAEFCAFAANRRGVFNASEQGTGKTATAWTTLHLWRSQRAIVVCPKSVIPEWINEYNLLFPNGAPIHPVPLGEHGVNARTRAIRSYALHPTPVALIVNYEVLAKLEPAIAYFQPDTFVCDESWRVMNRSARVTQSAIRISDLCRNVMLLTGTACGNDVGGLWAQLRMLLGSAFQMGATAAQSHFFFMQRYAMFQQITAQGGQRQFQKAIGVADPAGLMRQLEPVWYRATKATCLDLPPKQFHEVQLELSPALRDLYRLVERDGEAALGVELSLTDSRVVMVRLQQITGGHRPVPVMRREVPGVSDSDELGGDLNLLQDSYATLTAYAWQMHPEDCVKLQWLRDLAHDRLVGDRSIRLLVWAQFTHELRRIRRALAEILGEDAVFIADGSTKACDLEQAKTSFNSRHPDGVQVLVCQWKKMSAGHNLQAADIHVHHSLTWSYILWAQSQDRSHRAGREDAIDYYTLIARGTQDMDMLRALQRHENVNLRLSPDTTSAINGVLTNAETH